MGNHQSAASKTETWLTPPHILGALGGFDLDPCAAVESPAWAAPSYFTEPEDGLSKPWAGRVWLNPPYGRKTGWWLRKLADHGNGIALIFARTETAMFFESVWRAADGVFFFEGRLHFCFPNGRRAPANAGAPSCLVAYGKDNAAVLAACDLPGIYLPLSEGDK